MSRADAIFDAIASCMDCIVGEPHVCPGLGVEDSDLSQPARSYASVTETDASAPSSSSGNSGDVEL